MADSFQDATLVVLGHGTTLNADSALPVRQHAAELRRRGIFADVREAFWKQSPQVSTVLAGIQTPRIFIVPLFISEGYFASEVIPRELGFPSCPATRTSESTILHYTQPVGTHPGMTEIILTRAREVVAQFPFPRAPRPAETTLFIAGHGTERSGNSRESIEHQVERIRARQLFAAVEAIFMEEAPRIAGCQERAATKYVVVVPFFISDGLHTVEDIPVMLGAPAGQVKARLAAGQPTWRNPTEHHGRLTWYAPAVGTAASIADVILVRVREVAGVSETRPAL